jgi:hypothetical protein
MPLCACCAVGACMPMISVAVEIKALNGDWCSAWKPRNQHPPAFQLGGPCMEYACMCVCVSSEM